MRTTKTVSPAASLCLILLCTTLGCSPRDFLTRRLAADLISASEVFRTPQMFWLTTGVVSNKDFNSPDSMVLQRRGWISGSEEKCPPGVEPSPCWDVVLSPLGVETIRPLVVGGAVGTGPIPIQVARRQLVGVTGISKSGNLADVEFTWRWVSLNPIGAALYDAGVRYRSTVGFRGYDDGWRVVNEGAHTNQTMDDALRTAESSAP
jgi:hypothetical protein